MASTMQVPHRSASAVLRILSSSQQRSRDPHSREYQDYLEDEYTFTMNLIEYAEQIAQRFFLRWTARPFALNSACWDGLLRVNCNLGPPSSSIILVSTVHNAQLVRQKTGVLDLPFYQESMHFGDLGVLLLAVNQSPFK